MIKNFNFNQLKIFEAVARALSFTRAAEELHLTQPGISKHIRDLEAAYGSALFDRTGKKVILTQSGQILFKTVSEIFCLLKESKKKIEDLQSVASGKLTIGTSVIIGTYILPEMLVAFRAQYPNVDITVEVGGPPHVAKRLLDHTVEIGFACALRHNNKLVLKQFKTEHMSLIVSARHEWAKRKSPVPIERLANQQFVLSKPGTGTRELVEDFLAAKNIKLRKVIELGNMEGIKKAVEANLGISIISNHAIVKELAEGVIQAVPIKGMTLKRHLYVVWHKERYLSDVAKAFLRFVE